VWSYRAGGGESATMVAARWRRWAASVAAEIAERGTPVIAVTHAGVIRAALADASRLGTELALDVPCGSIHHIDLDTSDLDTSDLGAPDLGAADLDASWACTP
jgi:broad specificity phosphatase PhoE